MCTSSLHRFPPYPGHESVSLEALKVLLQLLVHPLLLSLGLFRSLLLNLGDDLIPLKDQLKLTPLHYTG